MPSRPAGLRVIIGYKLVKAPALLALALYMTLRPHATNELAIRLTHELATGGGVLRRLSDWLWVHLTITALQRARAVAWIDGGMTMLEAILLLYGKSWGEWLVVGGLALACFFELHALANHPSPLKSTVFVLNVIIVAYLVRRRIRAARRLSIA